MARRINVVGTSGNGKTTFSRALAKRLGLPHVELDALNHGPNWTEASDEEFRRAVEAATDRDGWVVDGNYGRKIGDVVLRQADTVVWLDQPLPLVLWRLWRRTIWRIVRREELWSGNRESWLVGGDLIVGADGQTIASLERLRDVIAAKKPGEALKLEVYRGTKKMTIDVELGRQPTSPQ